MYAMLCYFLNDITKETSDFPKQIVISKSLNSVLLMSYMQEASMQTGHLRVLEAA